MSYAGAQASFNKAAEQYDAARPSYPHALVEHIISRSDLAPDSRILEIGAGTGKASLLFAWRGYSMLCLEPGPQMAEVAERNLASHLNARVERSTFEDWPLQPGAFELAISAQAFHWIDPEVGFPKVAKALKPNGWLAFFWNLPSDPQDQVWDEIQKAYAQHAPALTKRWDVKTLTQEVEEIQDDFAGHAHLFVNPSIESFPWSRRYSPDEYIQLLGTYSDHIALADSSKAALFAAIKTAIAKHGGSLEKRYTAVLQMAKKP